MRRSAAIVGVLLFCAAPLTMVGGCEEESAVEEAAEETGEAIEDAGDEAADAVDDAVDEVEDAG